MGQTQKHLDTINTAHYLPWLLRKCNYVLLDKHTRTDIYSLSWQYKETKRFFQTLRLLYFNDDTTEPEKTNKMTDYGKWEMYVTNYNMHMLNTANCTPVNKIIVFFRQHIPQDRQDAFSSDHFTSSASQPTPLDMTQWTLTLGRKKHSAFLFFSSFFLLLFFFLKEGMGEGEREREHFSWRNWEKPQ